VPQRAALAFDLKPYTLPGDRLEALKGDRAGQHSTRSNRRIRLCFRWTKAGPEDVEIVDYR
jgi:proteic killer suppression protein